MGEEVYLPHGVGGEEKGQDEHVHHAVHCGGGGGKRMPILIMRSLGW